MIEKWLDLVKPDTKPRTEEENFKLREMALPTITRCGHSEFTCDTCCFIGARKYCPFIFDPYNTNGDCLAVK